MRKKILLVSDNDSIQKTLADLLNTDYECIPLHDADEGLLYLERNASEVDLVIIDLQTEAGDGFKLLENIANNITYRIIPVLALASLDQTQTEDITNAFNLGADDIIVTPLNEDITKRRIDNMLYVARNRMVYNVMEDLIEIGINEHINELGICTCPICRRDLLTMTLNNVTPKYVTTEQSGTIMRAKSLASRKENIRLLADITYYAQRVRENPSHG